MRLFVALTPPAEVLDDIDEAVRALADLADVDECYRWTVRSQWHITLAFLGQVDEEMLPDLRRRLARAAARHPAMALRVAGGGGFGSVRRARVLWAGVTGDVGPLRGLARSVAAAARRSGVELDERTRFRPHVTLARLHEPIDVRAAVDVLDAARGRLWEAREIALVESRLGQGEDRRSLYDTIATWPLGGRRPTDG
ncbi:MAG TPA: RNA 2',3'-cyclic phosphodiesterase [Actinopolymorphaceae bacterium]